MATPTDNSDLPPGFTLDTPSQGAVSDLPPGFKLDAPGDDIPQPGRTYAPAKAEPSTGDKIRSAWRDTFREPLGMSEDTYQKITGGGATMDPVNRPLLKVGSAALDVVANRVPEALSRTAQIGAAAVVPDTVHRALGFDPETGRAKMERDTKGLIDAGGTLSGAPGAAVAGADKTAKAVAEGGKLVGRGVLLGGVEGAKALGGTLEAQLLADAAKTAGGKVASGAKAVADVGPKAVEKLGSLAAGTPREGMLDLHRAGWKVPPAQAVENPGTAADLLSGLQGKVKINQAYSEANFKIATEKAKADLGMGEEDNLSHESLEAYREKVGRPAYNAVREVIPPMPVGDKLSKFTFADKYVKDGKLSPSDAIEWVKDLRFDAKANLRGAAEPEKLRLGMAQKAQADAVERQIETGINSAPQLLASNIKARRAEQAGLIKDITQKSNALAAELKKPAGMFYTLAEAAKHDAALAKLGEDIAEGRKRLSGLSTELEENLGKAARVNDLKTRSSLMQAYRDARTKIAKSYDIEDATTASGEIIPHRLAAMAAHGRPLSGGLKDIATAAERMPKAMQRPAQFGGTENISRLDLGYAVHEASKGNVAPALGALTRKLSRGVTSSEAYQRGMFGGSPQDVLEDLKGQMK